MGRRNHLLRWTLFGTLLAAVPLHALDQSLEYRVKAAYIFNLVNFAQWPQTAFASPTTPLRVCIADPDPFGSLLAQTFAGEHVDSHPIVVDHPAAPAGWRQCQVVFVPDDGRAGETALRSVEGAPVLTIGQTPGFRRHGGMVTFVVDNGRVRFDVDATSATRAGIRLSSKVLQAARNIR